MVRKSGFLSVVVIAAMFFCRVQTTHAAENLTTEFKLPNGLTVILYESHRTHTVALRMAVEGSIRAEGAKTGMGLSHFTEHLLATPYAEWGNKTGAVVNATTSDDSVNYFLKTTSDSLDEALAVFSGSFFISEFSDQLFQNEKNAVLNEVAGRTGNDDVKIGKLLREEVFRIHPYGRSRAGDPLLVPAVTKKDVEEYLRSRYVPAHMILVVAGDFDTVAMTSKVSALFGKIPAGPYVPIVAPQEPEQVFSHERFEKSTDGLAHFAIAFRGVSFSHPDAPALDMLAWVLSGGRSSRFHRKFVTTGKAQTLSAYSWTPTDPGFFSISGVAVSESLTGILKDLEDEFRDIKENGVSEEELQRVKTQLKVDFSRRNEDMFGVAARLAAYKEAFGNAELAEKDLERSLTVTSDDVRRVAEKYLVEKNRTTIVLSPDGNQSGAPLKDSATPFAFVREKLPNGATLLFRRDPGLAYGVVDVVVDYDTDRFSLSPAMRKLLPQMFARGTVLHSAEELAEYVEAQGGEFSVVGSVEAVTFHFFIPREAQAAGLYYLREIIEEPRLDPADLVVEKQRLMNAVRAARGNAWKEVIVRAQEFLFPEPFGARLTEADVALVDAPAVRDAVANSFCGERIKIVASGSFDTQDLRAFAEKLLATRQCLNAGRPILRTPLGVGNGLMRVEFSMPKPSNYVLLAFRGPVGSKTPVDTDRALLSAAAQILENRIYEAARGGAGISYNQGALSFMTRDISLVAGYVEVKNQADVAKAETILTAELQKLRDTPVSEEEFGNMLRAVRTEYALGEDSTETVVARVREGELLYGAGERTAEVVREMLKKLTPADLQKFAQTYFTPERGVLVIQHGISSE